jgi:hypothetical protein
MQHDIQKQLLTMQQMFSQKFEKLETQTSYLQTSAYPQSVSMENQTQNN